LISSQENQVKAVEIPFKAGGKVNRNLVTRKSETMEEMKEINFID